MLKKILPFLIFFISANAFSQERGVKFKSESKLSYDAKYAVLIGINDYKDKRINDLSFSTADAKAIATMLITELNYDPKNVVLLLDSVATRRTIIDTLSHFILNENISQNSQLLVYFAGHGTTVRNTNDINSLSGFLLTHDSMVGSEYSTGIDMDEVKRLAEKAQSKHVLYLLDACYGGLAKPRSATSNAFIQNVWEMKSREVITAGTGEETVLESPNFEHSVFTKVFLDAFYKGHADTNADDIISTAELYGYIQQRVPFYAGELGGKQTPQYNYLSPENGTFLFELSNGALSRTKNDSKTPIDEEEIASKFKSKLIIDCNVENARVYIDGNENRYINNKKGEYLLSLGMHTVEIKKDKYTTVKQEVVIQPDTVNTAAFFLESAITSVKFNVKPADAAILIDNNLIGTGSFATEIAKGRHSLTVEKRGFKPVNNVLNLTQNEANFSFDLEEIVAQVSFKSIPEGVLMIDNRDTLGYTPMTINLPYGKHSIVFQKRNYQPKVIDVNISESALLRYDAVMSPEPEYLAAKEARKQRSKHIGNIFIFSGLAYGAYYGYGYCSDQLSEIEANLAASPPIKSDKNNNKELYSVGKYGSLGLGAIFAIAGATNLVKSFTVSKKRILKKTFGETQEVSLNTFSDFGSRTVGLRASIAF